MSDGSSPGSPAIDAYLDARGAGRPAKSMLDEVARDATVLDELARDREWIDEVRTPANAPDQTSCILGRLGLDASRFDRRRHRFALLSRRFSTAALLVLAFVVGMWARSALVFAPNGQPVETAHRFERVIESLPIQMDPFDRVRGMMRQVGSSLAEPDENTAGAVRSLRVTSHRPFDGIRPASTRTPSDAGEAPATKPGQFLDEEFEIETMKAMYKDLGIV